MNRDNETTDPLPDPVDRTKFVLDAEGTDDDLEPENPYIEVTDAEIKALRDESHVLNSGNDKETAKALLEQEAFAAILSLTKLAVRAQNERVRLDASKYVIERVLGPVARVGEDRDPEKDPIQKLLKKAGMID
jgi:hypothetical protein